MPIHRNLILSVDCDACSMQHCDAQLPSIIIPREKIYSIVMNSWVTFLKQWSAEHNMPYGQALKSAEAKAAYNKAKGIKTGHKGAPSKTHKGDMDFTTKRGDKDFHRKGKDVRKARRPFEY